MSYNQNYKRARQRQVKPRDIKQGMMQELLTGRK